MLLDRPQVRTARDKRHIFAVSGQQAAEILADTTGAHNRDLHQLTSGRSIAASRETAQPAVTVRRPPIYNVCEEIICRK
jgi:hypothetical protein